jgi:translation initiation factor 1A
MPRGVKTARSMNKAPKREMMFKESGQEYGMVIKILGNGRMLIKFPDNTEKQCTVRGSMRRREWVNMNDSVLVAYRDFGDTHDIIWRYTEEEVVYLRRIQEIQTLHTHEDDQDDDAVVFEDVDAI